MHDATNGARARVELDRLERRPDRPDGRAGGDEVPLFCGPTSARDRRSGQRRRRVSVCAAPGRSARSWSHLPLLPPGASPTHTASAVAARSLGTSERAERGRGAIVGGVDLGDRAVSGIQRPEVVSGDGEPRRPIADSDLRDELVRVGVDDGHRSRGDRAQVPGAAGAERAAAAIAAASRSVPPATTSSRRRWTSARTAGPGAGVPSSGSGSGWRARAVAAPGRDRRRALRRATPASGGRARARPPGALRGTARASAGRGGRSQRRSCSTIASSSATGASPAARRASSSSASASFRLPSSRRASACANGA